jgi:tRNA threonylcarbamoyl adenosine modification protein YeaZ
MVLIFDTSRNKTLVILALNQKNIKKVIWDADFRHSEELLPEIYELLKKNNLLVNNLKGISIISGPGSYTGLRVGAACANAFGYALNIPVVGINKLELLANLGLDTPQVKNFKQEEIYLCSMVSAKVFDQFFTALYQVKRNQRLIIKQVNDFFTCDITQLNSSIKKQTLFLVEKDESDLTSFTLKKFLGHKFLGIKYFDLFSEEALEILVRLSFEKLKEKKPGEIVIPLYIRKPSITKTQKHKNPPTADPPKAGIKTQEKRTQK